jgi:Uma2 family endonuclease
MATATARSLAAAAAATATALSPHRFTVAEYYRMLEAGILHEDDRVELIDGRVVAMSPMGPPHAAAVDKAGYVLRAAVGARALVRDQKPLALDEYDEPEPDLAVVRPRADFYAGGHPGAGEVLLLVEVAESSLNYDRYAKATLYAAAGISEMWVVNLRERVLEVHREPGPAGYVVSQVYRPRERVTPLAFPDLELTVADLLPPGGQQRARAGRQRARAGRQRARAGRQRARAGRPGRGGAR